jgi:phosphinothricin acetyltransferase
LQKGNLQKMDRDNNEITPTIRLATESDAGEISAIYAPVVRETIISFETEPPSPDELRQRIVNTLERFPWLVCESDGRVAGYAYAATHRSRAAYRWCADVSAYVREDGRRTGVGRALYTSLNAVLVLQGYYNAYAGISLPNPASVRLHESVGFRPVGVYREVGYKLGGWHDVGWWQLALRERDAGPAPPVALPAVVGSGEWDAALSSGLNQIQEPFHEPGKDPHSRN